MCHGWMSEFDGACWARKRASSTNARGTGWGKKQPRRMALSDHLLKVEHGDASFRKNPCNACGPVKAGTLEARPLPDSDPPGDTKPINAPFKPCARVRN